MRLDHEENFDINIRRGLLDLGHILNEIPGDYGFTALTAISRNSTTKVISAVSDIRRMAGSVSIF